MLLRSSNMQNANNSISIVFMIIPVTDQNINPLTLELNPSAERCLTRHFTGDFAS
jgi:hypothetical protein